MIVKIVTIVLVSFIARSAGDDVWNSFTGSWALNTSTHFYDLPITEEAALDEGWASIPDVEFKSGIVALGYLGDPTIVLLFKNNALTGIQVAFRASDVDNSGQPINYASISAITPKTINNEKFYTATAFFYIDDLGTRRLAFLEKDRFFEVPTTASEVTENTPFLLKNCVPTMGIHYYPWDPTTDCATLYPWVLLSDGENITGFALQGIGTINTIGTREWFETVPANGLLRATSDPPTCVIEGVDEFGALSLHFWLVNNPKEITCN